MTARKQGCVWHSEELYMEVDMVYRRMTRGRYQHLAPLSKLGTKSCLSFFGHISRRSPCSTSFEEFVRFKLEEVTWPETQVLDWVGER
ncbi:hypothetical protein RB195_008796 [Necator americanus]|uniref:Uncharacterized protein n=1 Tax=Necator americanus TaxID=51031 RepID=A0ABR1CRK6_NECAM